MLSEKRIRNNRIRRQRQLRRNLMLMLFSAVLIVTLSVGGFAFGSKAQDKNEVILYKYYANVVVQYGESLEDIAETYFCEAKYDNYDEYINEVLRVNGMHNEEVTPGTYLIVPYYSSDFK